MSSIIRLKPVYLGDDLYARQPICESVQALGADFLFALKSGSHPHLDRPAERHRALSA